MQALKSFEDAFSWGSTNSQIFYCSNEVFDWLRRMMKYCTKFSLTLVVSATYELGAEKIKLWHVFEAR